MFDLNQVKALKSKEINSTENLLSEAIKLFDSYQEERNDDLLKQAANQFLSIIKVNRSLIEPYIYLAYIFYLFGDEQRARDYHLTAKKLDPQNEKVLFLNSFIY